MIINKSKPERDIVIELLKESALVLELAFRCFEELDEEDFERIIKSANAIDQKAMSIYICEDATAKDQVMPELLRRRFYEQSADEIFRLHRFLNELHGKENAVL